ncbi:MAG: hypothetical protein D6758_03835 [Gammaproteobacteria bacterium]|nr:MAG: hypothetical protein D6758_03835 [Gammaproteobacteria bacterium]
MTMTLNFRAIITGLIVNLLGSLAGAIVVVNFYASRLESAGMSPKDIEQAITEALMNPDAHSQLYLGLLAVGTFFDGLSGYVTARKAGFLEYWHVLAMVGLLVVMQLGAGMMAGGTTGWYCAALLLTIGGAFFGGWRAKMRRLKGGPDA